jgi:hypothetical protein
MGNLRISEDEFNELYPDLEGHYNFFNDPIPAGTSNEEVERRYLSSKLWRLNNLYSVIDKSGNPVTFRMNYAQHKVYAATRNHPRIVILKSRQQGISTFWLVSYFDDAVFCPFLNIGLMAQGTDEASTLLERTKFLWDTLDDDVKHFIGVNLEKDNTKEFAFSNKSTIFIRVSFRSTTLQRLHISEFGKIANMYPKRAKETKTGTLQALGQGNTGVMESTAEGRNMFKQIWDDSIIAFHSGQMTPKDFYPVFLSWLDDPDCLLTVNQSIDEEAKLYFDELTEKTGRKLTQEQMNFWIAQRRELGGDIFQEYPATPEEAFTASRDGTYYSRQFTEDVVRKGRVRSGVYDENLPVDVYFDLGVDDYAVLAFVQWYNGEWRIIDEYWNNGYAIQHYLEYIRDTGYKPRALRFPHDIKVREQTAAKSNGRAKSRLEIVQEWKKEHNQLWRVDVLPKGGVENGIEAVRRIIPKLIIDTKCTYLMDCMLNYSKEWDDKLQVWKKTPLHDEYSHGADTIRQIASSTIESKRQHASKLEEFYGGRAGRSSGFAL